MTPPATVAKPPVITSWLEGLGGCGVIQNHSAVLNASAASIALAGAKTVFADIGDDGNIDPAAIEAAIADSEAAENAHAIRESSEEEEGKMSEDDGINLRQRAAPFIALLKESAAGDASVVWGV